MVEKESKKKVKNDSKTTLTFFSTLCFDFFSTFFDPGGREAPGTLFQPSGPAEVQCEFFGPISGLNFGR